MARIVEGVFSAAAVPKLVQMGAAAAALVEGPVVDAKVPDQGGGSHPRCCWSESSMYRCRARVEVGRAANADRGGNSSSTGAPL